MKILLTVCLVIGVGHPCSAQLIPLTNPSFEDPVGEKTVGDATWSNIPGWTSTGPSADSGVEAFSPAPQPDLGINIAFLQSGDGSIFQTTSHVIGTDDGNYQLQFYERDDWQTTELTATLYYETGGVRTPFFSETIETTAIGRDGPLSLRTLIAPSPAAGVGTLLGVEFENTSLGGATGSWAWVDLVQLQMIGGPGDVNNDGVVDHLDYEIIRDNFRMSVSDRSQGDLNGDGVVDFHDYLEWRAHATVPAAGAQSLATLVPEPSSLVLGVAAMIGLAVTCRGSRRRHEAPCG